MEKITNYEPKAHTPSEAFHNNQPIASRAMLYRLLTRVEGVLLTLQCSEDAEGKGFVPAHPAVMSTLDSAISMIRMAIETVRDWKGGRR